MIVKNIGSSAKYFQFGPRVRGFTLEAGAQRFVPDSEVALEFAQKYVTSGDMAIVGGPSITTVLTPAAIPASLPITLQGQPSAADTVTIDGVVFTFKAADDGSATTVEIGADVAASAAALAEKVNAYTGVGFEMRAQAGVTIGADEAVVLYSKRPGTLGDGAFDEAAKTGHTVTVSGTNLTKAITNPAGGRDSKTVKVVTFKDTLAGGFTLPYQVFTGFSEIVNVQLTVLTSAGAPKTITDTLTTENGVVQITSAGAEHLEATDDVHLTVTGR